MAHLARHDLAHSVGLARQNCEVEGHCANATRPSWRFLISRNHFRVSLRRFCGQTENDGGKIDTAKRKTNLRNLDLRKAEILMHVLSGVDF